MAPRVAALDWSGARHGEARHLWIAEWDPSRAIVSSLHPSSRRDAVCYMMDLAARDDQAVVGLDFSFSFPEWWLDACGVEDPTELWDDTLRLESWLDHCPAPFWGRPGRRRPPLSERQHYRATELAAPLRPKSVFQIGGAGAVGTGSLRGMPALALLRRAGFAIWPFDDARGRPVAAEVWPRLAAPQVVKRRPGSRLAWLEDHAAALGTGVAASAAASDDAFDAVAAVIALAGAGRDGLVAATDRLVRREGWIAGVALPPTATPPTPPTATPPGRPPRIASH